MYFCLCSAVVRRDLEELNHIELSQSTQKCPLQSRPTGKVRARVGRLSLYITVVRRGSVQSNLLEVTPNCPSRKLPPSSQWFETVRCGRTAPNSLQLSLWACFPLCHSDSRRFGVFEPPQTHSNLPCRPSSPYIIVVRGGSVQSNFLKLSPNCPSRKPPPSPCEPASPFVYSRRFGVFLTSPNTLKPSL